MQVRNIFNRIIWRGILVSEFRYGSLDADILGTGNLSGRLAETNDAQGGCVPRGVPAVCPRSLKTIVFGLPGHTLCPGTALNPVFRLAGHRALATKTAEIRHCCDLA